MRIRKLRRGNAGGYEWKRDGDVVDVDDEKVALDLTRMAGFEAVDPLPEPVWVPGAVVQDLPVVRTHVPIRKEKTGGAAHYNWSHDGAVVLVDVKTALELLGQPGFSEADEDEIDIRDIEGAAQDELKDPAEIVPSGATRIVPKSQRSKSPV